jgi:16S rRNA (guanine(527)-N(7))-methyltransferase RsmG
MNRAFDKTMDIIVSNDEINNINIVVDKLKSYIDIIVFWRKTHNIISNQYNVDDLWDNVFDSINFCSFLAMESEIVDAGAGNGFPGIPLAIIFPLKKFYLVDHHRKKCSFLRLVKARLALDNVQVVNRKLEKIERHQMIITKAAFSPSHAAILANSVIKEGRIAIWSTAKTARALIEELKKYGVFLSTSFNYVLPSGKERCLLLFTKI